MKINKFKNTYEVSITKKELKKAFESLDNFNNWYSELIDIIVAQHLKEIMEGKEYD